MPLVLLFLLLSLTGPQLTPGQDPRDRAAALWQSGEAAPAIEELRRWCAAAPADAGRWRAAAQFLMARGDHVSAQQFTRPAAELQPADLPTLQLHATALLLGHQSREAERILVPLARAHPKDADLAFQLGMAQAANQEFQQAAESLDHALSLRPDSGMFHFWAGDNCERLNRLEDAEAHLRRALSLQPAPPDAAWKLATVLAHRGQAEQAEAMFRAALEGPPGRALQRTAFHYGVFLFERERDAEAEPHLRGVVRDWPEHRMAWHYLARVQRRTGQTREAARSLQRYQALQHHENELEESALVEILQRRLGRSMGR